TFEEAIEIRELTLERVRLVERTLPAGWVRELGREDATAFDDTLLLRQDSSNDAGNSFVLLACVRGGDTWRRQLGWWRGLGRTASEQTKTEGHHEKQPRTHVSKERCRRVAPYTLACARNTDSSLGNSRSPVPGRTRTGRSSRRSSPARSS